MTSQNMIEKAADLLIKHGYELIEVCAPTTGGHLYVADPVQCSSGSKKWMEYRSIRIGSYVDALSFIEERS